MPFDCNYVFVYGTLKKGFHNNRILDSPNVSYIGPAHTLKPFKMVSPIGFPYVIDPRMHLLKRDELKPISGEVFLVKEDSVKNNLDRLEGYPYHYDRIEVEVSIGNGEFQKETAIMYVAYRNEDQHFDNCPTSVVNETEMYYFKDNPFNKG